MNPSPQTTDRQIRVFISSTFRDMQEERDILIKKIFPQLRKLCEERSVAWTEVDLRWGITTEEAAEGKVLPLCLEEIHRCRPYFIGLLGERYGSLPREIPPDLIERQPWLEQHREKSITELEIIHGVLSEEEMHGHAYFYFRDPKYLVAVPAEKRTDFTAESAEAAGKLAKLKQKLRGARDEQVCELRENYATPEQLGEWIFEDFTKLIDRLYPKDQTPDPLDQEAARHEAYARSRRLAFVGREDLLRRLNEHAAAPGKPLLLTGESGCGKSALLAEWVASWRKDHPDALVIQHYIGSTPDSADWQGLVRRILGELKRAFAITDEIPVQPDTLRNALREWVAKSADPRRRFILVFDALNQLTEDGAAQQLGWLPSVFPSNFRVLISSLPSEGLDAMRERGWPELNVPLFASSEIAPAAVAYLKIFSKTPSPELLAKLEATPATCNALYLRAVLDELRQFGSHQKVEATADDYLSTQDLPELFDKILARWEGDYGRDLVGFSFSLLWAARRGLTEVELLHMLSRDDNPLPRLIWLPLSLAAGSHLVQRSGLLSFGHTFLRNAVERRYVPSAEKRLEAHQRLASYFAQSGNFRERVLVELPWQLAEAMQWQILRRFVCTPNAVGLLYFHMPGDLHHYWSLLERNLDITLPELYGGVLEGNEWNSDDEMRRIGLRILAQTLDEHGYPNAADDISEHLLANARKSGEEEDLCLEMSNHAGRLIKSGRLDEAERLSTEALSLAESSPFLQASILKNLTHIYFSRGDYDQAVSFGERAVAIFRQQGDTRALLPALRTLAMARLHKGRNS